MFNTVDTMHDCTRIATGVVSTLKINPDRMLAGLSADMLATDLAEYLVRKGAQREHLVAFISVVMLYEFKLTETRPGNQTALQTDQRFDASRQAYCKP